MKVIVERLEYSDNWDEELDRFRGSIYMTGYWLSVISNNERRPVYLRFIEDNETVALLGGLEFSILKGPARQLFFYSGIAAGVQDSSLIKRCKTALYEYARENGYQRVSMRSYDHHSYLHARVKQFKEKERMEYVLYLDKDKEQLIKGFDGTLRRSTRKSKREGVLLKNSNSVELTDNLFSLLNETYNIRQSKGYGAYEYLYLPFFNRNEVERLLRNGHAKYYFAEKDNEILSIKLVFYWKKRAYFIFMGTSQAGYKAGAPSFLFYELPLLLKEQGYSYYNIGGVQRSIKHRGLKVFKDKLGAEIVLSAEELTNFLSPPLSYLNPFLELKWFLRNFRYIPWKIKLPIIFLIDLIIKKRDQY